MNSFALPAPLLAVRRRFLAISLGSGIGMSLLNSFGLQFLYAYFIEGNVNLEAISSAVSALIAFLHIAALFVGYAVMVYGTFLFGERASRIFFFANLIQVGAASLASLGVSYFSMTPALFLYNLGNLLLYLFLNLLVYLALLLLIRVGAVLLRRRETRAGGADITLRGQFVSLRHPLLRTGMLTTVIYIASALIMSIIETVSDLLLYGLPVNMEETVYLISPYIEEAAYFFIGYTVLTAVFYLLQSQHERVLARFEKETE